MIPTAWHLQLTGDLRERLLSALHDAGGRGDWAFVDLDDQTIELLTWGEATIEWLDRAMSPLSIDSAPISVTAGHTLSPTLFPGGRAPQGYLPTLAELSWRTAAGRGSPAKPTADDLASKMAVVHRSLAGEQMNDSLAWHRDWLAAVHQLSIERRDQPRTGDMKPEPDASLDRLGRELRVGCDAVHPAPGEVIPFGGTVTTATVSRLAHVHAVQLGGALFDPHLELQAIFRLSPTLG